MPADDELRLAELMCARLCHDLAGPIGAAAAGIELLSEDDGGDIAPLLGASIGAAARQLNFLRRAFGRSTAPAAAAALRRLVEESLAGWPSAERPGVVEWSDAGEGDWPADHAKLVLNLVLVARDCLPRGGRLTVRLCRPPLWRIEIEAAGRLSPGEALPALAAAGAEAVSPRGAPAYYAACLARRLGGRFDALPAEDNLRLVVLPAG